MCSVRSNPIIFSALLLSLLAICSCVNKVDSKVTKLPRALGECKVDKEIRWVIRLLKVNEWAEDIYTIAIVMSVGDACIMVEALNESSPDNYTYTIEEL